MFWGDAIPRFLWEVGRPGSQLVAAIFAGKLVASCGRGGRQCSVSSIYTVSNVVSLSRTSSLPHLTPMQVLCLGTYQMQQKSDPQ